MTAPYVIGEMVWMHVMPRQFDHVVWVEECHYIDCAGEWLFDVWWIGQYQKIRARAVSETMLEKCGHVVEFPQNTQNTQDAEDVVVPESQADDEDDHPATLGIKARKILR